MGMEGERIAVLETQMKDLQEQLPLVIDELKSLRETMTKYKGFVGGIMFTISAVGTAIGALFTYWFQKQ